MDKEIIDNLKKAIFVAKKMFAQLVYDFQSLEGMPFIFPEVKTFIQGITIGGHKIADHDKLKQQQLAWKRLINLVEQNKFQLSEKISCELEGIAAKDEALEPGILPCPIPARRLNEYNIALMKLYKDGLYKPVIDFHKSCHKELYKEWKMEYPV